MTEYNRANVHLEVADVPGNENGVENQIEEALEAHGIDVEVCHVKAMKYPIEN